MELGWKILKNKQQKAQKLMILTQKCHSIQEIFYLILRFSLQNVRISGFYQRFCPSQKARQLAEKTRCLLALKRKTADSEINQ